jgi:HK97 family phage prohead protease
MQAPTEKLSRSVDFSAFETRDADGDGLTLEGYAAVFNSDTVIDSWEGNFVERIAPGAFKRTLKNQKPVMQFDHGRDSRVGSTPIGAFETLAEDDRGLFVRARLHDNDQVRPVRDAIASGAIEGMSFRFSVVREAWDDPSDAKSLPVRTIQEARLYELGPVVFPAYADTSVGVRSVLALAQDPTFREELLRALTSEPAPGTSVDLASTSDTSSPDEERNADEEEPAADTSVEEPVDGTSERGESTDYAPVERPTLPLARLLEQRDELRQMVATAAASSLE